MASFTISKQQQQKLTSRFSLKGLKTDIFNLTNIIKTDVKEKDPTVKLASVKPRRIFQSGLVKPAAATAKSNLADSICITVNNVPETIVTGAPVNKGKGRR